MRRIAACLGAITAVVAIAACGEDGGRGDASLAVVASNEIVADWVAQIGGDNVAVDSLVPPGADLHSFQLTPREVRRVAEADLVVLIGAGLEGTFQGTVEQNAGGPVLELAEAVGVANGGAVDPHIWMDLDLAIASVERIAGELATLDEANAATYDERAADYIAELESLDDEIRGLLADLAPEDRLLVTYHDAFGYFADRYGLEVLGFLVEGADEEPDARHIAGLVDAMKEHGASTVYVEPQFDARVIERVASEAGAEVRVIPSATLSDEYPTYIEMMRTIAHGIAD